MWRIEPFTSLSVSYNRTMGNAIPLWTLQMPGHRIDAELLGQGEHGWELRLLRDGKVYASQRFVLHAEAVAFGEQLRHELSTGKP